MEELTTYLGFGDYVFILATGLVVLVIFGAIVSVLDGSQYPGEIIPLIIIFAAPILVAIYVNYIPYGVYKANFTKINGKTIGVGTKGSDIFTIDIDRKYLKFDNKDKLPLYNTKFSPFLRVYGNKDFRVSVTIMGTVKINSKVLKANLKVDY